VTVYVIQASTPKVRELIPLNWSSVAYVLSQFRLFICLHVRERLSSCYHTLAR